LHKFLKTNVKKMGIKQLWFLDCKAKKKKM